jgi:DivIVA domain-containing protein
VSTRDYAQRVDRDAIERRDFPIGRRGYDQAAVDDHLRRVADKLEALRPVAPASLAAGTSEKVRMILEAAEASAADLRADAARRSGEHIARVERASGAMPESLARLHEQAAALGAAGEPPKEDFAAAAPEPSADAPSESSHAAAAPSPNGDEAGARLIALNMALSGTPREETARYLAEHFELPDAEALLDDVYERAGR